MKPHAPFLLFRALWNFHAIALKGRWECAALRKPIKGKDIIMKIRNGFTLMELLIVVAIIGLLVLFLLPSISPRCHSRKLAKRIKCASQVRSIALAAALYQNEYEDKLPVMGGENVTTGYFGTGLYNTSNSFEITRWYDPAFTDPANAIWSDHSTVGASLYLLVRTVDLSPKQFLCPSDAEAEEIDLEYAIEQAARLGGEIENFGQLNDFHSMANLSYSYRDPWKHVLTDSAKLGSNSPLAADKSNGYATDTGSRNPRAGIAPAANGGDWTSDNGTNPRHGNSKNHDTDTQNVAFADAHVERAMTPLVGLREDNIYTRWPNDAPTEEEMRIGRWDGGNAMHMDDAYLGN